MTLTTTPSRHPVCYSQLFEINHLEQITGKSCLSRVHKNELISKRPNCSLRNFQECDVDLHGNFSFGMSDLDAGRQASDLILPTAARCQHLLTVQNLLTTHNCHITSLAINLSQVTSLSTHLQSVHIVCCTILQQLLVLLCTVYKCDFYYYYYL